MKTTDCLIVVTEEQMKHLLSTSILQPVQYTWPGEETDIKYSGCMIYGATGRIDFMTKATYDKCFPEEVKK